jgi:glycosyltransferase involved in cell wall biosynthesis
MIILSHPTGNNNVREAAVALAESEQLQEFHTCIAACGNNVFQKLGCIPGLSEINRRACPDSLFPYLQIHPWREICRLAAVRMGFKFLTKHESRFFSIDAIYKTFDKSVANCVRKSKPSAAYCYEDGALETFREAKKNGAKCIYDLPIGYWRAGRKIMEKEAELRPEWAPTMLGLQDSKEKLERKEQELQLSDHIVVASSFTRKTLEICSLPLPQISIIPYGCGSISTSPVKKSKDAPLRALFVGGLSQRKGIADLFEAVHLLKGQIALTLIGCKPVSDCPVLNNALKVHNWIPSLPHEKILREMRNHDVLVFPSLFEGFGLVITEALSQGLPVITTPHTCGPDIITDGQDGFIVPIRSSEAIALKLEKLCNNQDLLYEMRLAALEKAKHLNWFTYHSSISSIVDSIIKQNICRC